MNAKTFQDFRRLFKKNLWQSIEWSNFQIQLGNSVFFFGDDEAIGMGVLKSLPFGYKYLEIPRGPMGITDKTFWEEIEQVAKENSCVFTRISPESRMQKLPRFHCKADMQIFPQDTLILDLQLNEEDLLKQMKPKGRYNIRIAQRYRVKVYESDNVEDFYQLLKETTDRDKFSGHTVEYYKTMLKTLSGNAKLYLASAVDEKTEQEEVIAGGIFTFLDDTCIYYYGASSNNQREKMAPYILQWHVISEAKEQGYKYYDFLGIAPEKSKNHSLSGVTRFKKQFGGKHVSYPAAQDIIYKPFVYLAYRLVRFLKNNW